MKIFVDGYMCILYKFESLFLDGDPFDRIQIWKILGVLFTNWSSELLRNNEETPQQSASNKESLELFFDYITGLVCKYSAINGHRDQVFLSCCCESFIQV